VFVASGLIAFIMSLVGAPVWLPFAVLILASLVSVGFSLRYFLRNEKSKVL
jgi:hypothetical protein